ncbi:hypothetical protein [Sphingomonas sp. CROZ-RG-20F-R02-07]|uniref:hypothetical protein n=1 Tax=Sphingomonas sp. CROZ-RG-20F-R02-07 TaxID=2914832 RepID=UPI001F57616F|nr:hypothetical protein [Sphingomonas sp. CROZ-RG-20F-R02-07]
MIAVTGERNDLSYYYRRHEQCQKMAASSLDQNITKIHLELAGHYSAMIYEIEAIGAPLKLKPVQS